MENYINIIGKNYDQPIYRILSINRLIEVFNSEQLTLTSPRVWEDPRENFILNATFRLGGEIVEFEAQNSLFAQCWMTTPVSDAMWRIYSPDSQGVRIRTTIRKLIKSLSSSVQHPTIRAFIGKVKYYPESKLPKEAKKVIPHLTDTNGKGQARSLLIKRLSFKHESEVRLIYMAEDNHKHGNFFKFDAPPHELIETMLVDPRASKEVVDLYRYYFKNNLKFKGRFSQSKLYQPKKFKFDLPG